MPVQRCMKNGKPGWRWGSRGKCFTGKDARKRALADRKRIEFFKRKNK